MKIAFLGSRGIPACYSGFETFYEQLATRLVRRGHSVTVYSRSHFTKYAAREYKGVCIVRLPCIHSKHLETISHTFLSTIHALFQRYDIAYYSIVGNAPLACLPRLVGTRTLLNVDGEDWAREKWTGFAKSYLRWCERLSSKTANVLISDAHRVQDRYSEVYGVQTVFAPYGANIQSDERIGALTKRGLKERDYILFVGRLVPENAADLLIEAFGRVKTNMKLVIVGDAPYVDAYKDRIHAMAGDRVVFTGYVFGEEYVQLSSHAYLYVQPSGVDGTRPALLDQLGMGNCVLVRDSAVNMEVVGDCGVTFDRSCMQTSLVEKLQELVDSPDVIESCRSKARSRIEKYYNWEWITDFYEDLFKRMLTKQPIHSYDDFLAARRA